MHLYRTFKGNILINDGKAFIIYEEWDALINQKNLFQHLLHSAKSAIEVNDTMYKEMIAHNLLAPIGSQEIWAAGVTYMRSRDARMEEAKNAGSSDFYQKVYEAERPELFFKSLPHRVAGHRQQVYMRRDSTWNVPEPELTLFLNSFGEIQAYTIGNDMSSRSIEGENPLYLPQAKSYERSAALGPCLFVTEKPLPADTNINLQIVRNGKEVFAGSIQINRMKRSFSELSAYLFRECDFANGCFLMTGTGIVPPDDFTLHKNDEINISIDGIGTLTNVVGEKL